MTSISGISPLNAPILTVDETLAKARNQILIQAPPLLDYTDFKKRQQHSVDAFEPGRAMFEPSQVFNYQQALSQNPMKQAQLMTTLLQSNLYLLDAVQAMASHGTPVSGAPLVANNAPKTLGNVNVVV